MIDNQSSFNKIIFSSIKEVQLIFHFRTHFFNDLTTFIYTALQSGKILSILDNLSIILRYYSCKVFLKVLSQQLQSKNSKPPLIVKFSSQCVILGKLYYNVNTVLQRQKNSTTDYLERSLKSRL